MKLLHTQSICSLTGKVFVLALIVSFSSIKAQMPTDAVTSLPLKMNAFNAKLNANKVELNWEVSEQMNISHYVVERNLNGNGFDDAGVVIAHDDGLNKYKFT